METYVYFLIAAFFIIFPVFLIASGQYSRKYLHESSDALDISHEELSKPSKVTPPLFKPSTRVLKRDEHN